MPRPTFKPGNTKAKGGARPGAGRKPKAVTELRQRLLENEADVEAAYGALMKKVKAGDSECIRFRLEMTWGKAKQSVDMRHSGAHVLAAIDEAEAAWLENKGRGGAGDGE